MKNSMVMANNNVIVVVVYDKVKKEVSLYSENGVTKCFDTLYDAECKRDDLIEEKNLVARVASMWV